MISTIFRQTRPVIYLVLIGFLTVFYWTGRALDSSMGWTTADVFSSFGAFLLLVLSIFLLGWMANENRICEYQSMPMLFFAWCYVLFPDKLGASSVLGGQFIVMFSAYKLLGIKDNKKSVFVFFDAGALVMLASWFDPWALMFLVPLFISVLMHNRKQFKDWLALFSGVAAIGLLFFSIGTLRGDPWLLFKPYAAWLENIARFPVMDTGLDHYLAWGFILLMAVLGLFQMIRAGHQTTGRISPVRLIASYIFTCLLLMVLNYQESSRQVQYSFFASAFFLSRMFEAIPEKPREYLLLLVLTLPFIRLILGLFI